MRAVCVDPRFSEIRPKSVRLAVILMESMAQRDRKERDGAKDIYR